MILYVFNNRRTIAVIIKLSFSTIEWIIKQLKNNVRQRYVTKHFKHNKTADSKEQLRKSKQVSRRRARDITNRRRNKGGFPAAIRADWRERRRRGAGRGAEGETARPADAPLGRVEFTIAANNMFDALDAGFAVSPTR
ncbi:hypothetical protein EVAR_26647_1 [Eumeta japonica]|uniref:Uncharacterized protein n=1 Tax=Eumeta variegata TaxID=151549 RepID=A0A4C1VP71_EUMVA|nr:hypothetical protein EVAR_26647_1 [Eumeta japonica]